MLVGVDTGGTFTDLVIGGGHDAPVGTVLKVPSTPDAPTRAIADAVRQAGGEHVTRLVHGTTVATNALLTGNLGRVALVATRGFADVIEIARQARPSLYDQRIDRPAPLVPRALRFEVAGRLDALGHELEPFDGEVPPGLLDALTNDAVDAIAVCLLHADLDPRHEEAVATAIARVLADRAVGERPALAPVRVVTSHEVSPEYREYERTVTTVLDAALLPACTDYLTSIDALVDDVLVMTSAGGLVTAARAATHPAALLVSGPAAGVQAAAAVAVACGYPDAVSFDMGGTSTDVCLVRAGVPERSPGLNVRGYPVRLPSLAVHTIGAGGGSIARLDTGRALVVGPESAGARPGPACYGLGGREPTVTDADLLLGRIPGGTSIAGIGVLDEHAATDALDALGIGGAPEVAAGVVAVVDAAMERAVRAVTVEQGVDPRGVALVAFGGAGPMHACAIAEALGMRAVVVPARAGVFSAVGLLCSPRAEEVVQSWPGGTDAVAIDVALATLERLAVARVRLAAPAGDPGDSAVADDVTVERHLDCRYVGQSHELTVAHEPGATGAAAWDAFHAVHEQRNGFARRDVAVEVIALRVRVSAPPGLRVEALPPPDRARVVGPRVVAEPDCTMWVPQGWTAEPGPTGAWVITRD